MNLPRNVAKLAVASALALIGLGLASNSPASATKVTYPYEVTVDWQMSSVPNIPDNTPEPNGPFEWPQSRLDGLPSPTCTPVAIQQDTYTINNESDKHYLAKLTSLSSPSDDARLSPHNYFAEVIVDRSACQTNTPTPTPTSSTPTPTPTPTPTSSAPSSTPPTSSTPPATTPPASSTPPSTSTPPTTVTTTKHSTPPVHRRTSAPPVSKSRTPQFVKPHTPKHPTTPHLAQTGFEAGKTAELGGAAVLLGGGLIALGRKRRTVREH